MDDFKGKARVVTGAAGEIGLETPKLLASRGAEVLLVDPDGEKLGQAAEKIGEAGGKAHTFAADVSDSGQVQAYAERAADLWGGVDLFFNNAGIEGAVKPIVEYPRRGF